MVSIRVSELGQTFIKPHFFFWLILVLTTAVKLAFAGLIPVIGDEAMYGLWTRQLDYGYFDHPPVVSWLLYPIFLFGKSAVLLRLPAVLISSVCGIIVYLFLKKYDDKQAALVASLFLISPASLLAGIFYSPETPLIVFSVLSGIAYFQANKTGKSFYYLISGIFLGMAFLSKYFAALLGIAFVVYAFYRPNRTKIAGLLLVAVSTAPFIFINLLWNYNHCWANIMHNFINRVEDAEISIKTPIVFLASVFYLALPFLPAVLFRKDQTVHPKAISDKELQFFAWLFIVPLLIFVLALFFKSVRLHWLLSFYPFAFIFLSRLISIRQLLACLKFTVIFSAIHFVAIVALLGTYDRLLEKDSKVYKTAISTIYHAELGEQLQPYRDRYHFFTTSYSYAALLSFYLDEDVSTFGGRSFRGRQDDLRKDFRTLDRSDFIIVFRKPPNLERYGRFFDSAEVQTLSLADTELFLLLGHGFKYQLYRDEVISRVIKKYYDIPTWLPVGHCYMFEKYR